MTHPYSDSSRTATIRTTVARAETVAAAIRPDNTDEMMTTVEDDTVVTTIERETTGGLQSTVDDYVVNLDVATRVIDIARSHVPSASTDEPHSETNGTVDTNTNTTTTKETNDQQ